MDFNQICISNSPMYALSVKQLSAKSKHLNVFNKHSNSGTLYRINKPTLVEIGATIRKYQPMRV